MINIYVRRASLNTVKHRISKVMRENWYKSTDFYYSVVTDFGVLLG